MDREWPWEETCIKEWEKSCRHIGDYESHGSPTIKILPPTTVSLSLTNFNLDIFQYNFRRCPGMWNDSIKWFNRWYRLYAFPLKKNPFRVLTDSVSVCIANWSDKRKDPWFSSSSLSKCCWPDRIWRWNWRKAYELTRNKFAIFICLEKNQIQQTKMMRRSEIPLYLWNIQRWERKWQLFSATVNEIPEGKKC